MSGNSIILASVSVVRGMLLRNAGVSFECRGAGVDEERLKAEFHGLPPADLAMALAKRKALAVSSVEKRALVIGADQVVNFQCRALGKPSTLQSARERLWEMRGKTHVLETAVACARGGDIVWSHLAQSSLTMRDFSGDALDEYCRKSGEALLSSAGAYQLEALGIQLFDEIDGDYFAILGLPLLPLLGFLRSAGVLAT